MNYLKQTIKTHVEALNIAGLTWRDDYIAQLTASEQEAFNVAAFPLTAQSERISRASVKRTVKMELTVRQRIPATNHETAIAAATTKFETLLYSFETFADARWHCMEIAAPTVMDALAREDLIFSATVALTFIATQNAYPEVTTETRTVTPTADGLSVTPAAGKVLTQVTVAGDANFIAANIRAGTTIWNVAGAYVGGDTPSITLQAKSATPTTAEQTIAPDAGYNGLSAVTIAAATLQDKTATPATTAQTIVADNGHYGLSSVTVAGDNNLAAGNIKSGVTIFGIEGAYAPETPEITLQDKSATPTTTAQTIEPDADYDGLSSVTVGAVTAAIDANIAAGNIKNGVAILGVTGNYEGTGGDSLPTTSPDGRTWVYATMQDYINGLTLNLVIKKLAANYTTIDWGDGSENDVYDTTGAINLAHTYATGGDYIIKIDGEHVIGDETNNFASYSDYVHRVLCGAGCSRVADYAFKCTTNYQHNSLDYISIPTAASVGRECFRGANLAECVFPSGSNVVSQYMFAGCINFSKLTITKTSAVQSFRPDIFQNVRRDFLIYVPSALLNDYKTESGWSDYAARIIGY